MKLKCRIFIRFLFACLLFVCLCSQGCHQFEIIAYKILFANLVVTSNQKTYNRYTKNKKQEIKTYHQKKITFAKRKTGKKRPQNYWKTHKIARLSPYLSMIILNVNGRNSPIKSHRVILHWSGLQARSPGPYPGLHLSNSCHCHLHPSRMS